MLALPRKARRQSESGIYHIVMRGLDRQMIFKEAEDFHRFLQTLKFYKTSSGYEVFAYCLMSNHIHLLLKIGSEALAQVIRRICCKYVYWYNHKYERCGYLFQGRFKSEPVENDTYFLTALRYIHRNPLEAGMVKRLDAYPWSSYHSYLGRENLVDTEFALRLFGSAQRKALDAFIAFNEQKTKESCLDVDNNKRVSDRKALLIAEKIAGKGKVADLGGVERPTRDVWLAQMKEAGLTVRQIERLTGINRGQVLKA